MLSPFWGDEGIVARRLQSYESRPEQIEMARAVQQSIEEKQHLIVEAGTGVGKSFAYLAPAILAATAGAGQDAKEKTKSGQKKKCIVISTHTISLQEQLYERDLPFLNSVLPVEFSAVLVKGRSNYISLRRMFGAKDRAGSPLLDARRYQPAGSDRRLVKGHRRRLPARTFPSVRTRRSGMRCKASTATAWASTAIFTSSAFTSARGGASGMPTSWS